MINNKKKTNYFSLLMQCLVKKLDVASTFKIFCHVTYVKTWTLLEKLIKFNNFSKGH